MCEFIVFRYKNVISYKTIVYCFTKNTTLNKAAT